MYIPAPHSPDIDAGGRGLLLALGNTSFTTRLPIFAGAGAGAGSAWAGHAPAPSFTVVWRCRLTLTNPS